MVALHLKPILQGPFSLHCMSNALLNCSVSSLFVNLPHYNLLGRNLLNKNMGVLGQRILKRNNMSTSITPTEETEVDIPSTTKLTKDTANSLVMKLTSDERTILLDTLTQFESDEKKATYRGELAAYRWRTKLGRPSDGPRLGDVDPTGTFCPVPENWLQKKYAETVPSPTGPQLLGVAIHNAIPFIGFGFLDNFLMIICGDYIELTLGSFITLSTMAAAALGNTFSDVLGLGCAGYVETIAARVGCKAPNLSPTQLDMKSSRTSANIGRGIGVTIGCLLGMIPLLFINKDGDKEKDKKKDKKKDKEKDKEKETATASAP